MKHPTLPHPVLSEAIAGLAHALLPARGTAHWRSRAPSVRKPFSRCFGSLFVIVLALLFSGGGQIAHAAIIPVTNNANSGPGTLREAIIAANGDPGSTITLPADTYNLSNELPIIAVAVTITGDGAGVTIIDGGAHDRVFHITSADKVKISGVTIRNGRTSSTPGGGGIWNDNGTLELERCTVTGNTSSSRDGGGIYNKGTMTLTDSTVSMNSAERGGGIYSRNLMTLTACTVTDNSSNGSGGGIYSRNPMTLIRCTVADNISNGSGGGIYSTYTLTLTDTMVSMNSAAISGPNDGGGGIYSSGTMNLTACTINGNTTPGRGGAIYIQSQTLTAINSTLSGNTAADGGASSIAAPQI